MPIRHVIARSQFRLARRALLFALVLTVGAPCVFLIAFGWQDWQDRIQAARDTTERSTYIAEEHAQKILDIDAALAERVLDTLHEPNFDTLAESGRSRTSHDYLQHLIRGYGQVDALSVWKASGQLGATSIAYPAPDISIVDRYDFIEAKAQPDRLYVSGPIKGRVTGNATFNIMKGQVRPDGTFAGLVSVSMSAAYFENFYRQLADDNPITIGLIRKDGAILAWWPDAGRRSDRIATDTPFFKLLASGRDAGLVTMISSVDGEEKVLAFRRVGTYDVYASAGMTLRSVREAWLARMSTLALATAMPSVGLFVLVLFSLRRLRHEERLWVRAEEESAMRLSAEAAAKENQRLETLGNMVALVAHDFNNLLMSILGYAQAASRAATTERADWLDRIVGTVQRGESLTRRLLSVGKKQPVRPEKFNLIDWSRHIDLLQAAVGEGVQIDVTVQNDLWDCYADQAELELALLNIAINAREAMDGRGRLSIEITNVELSSEASGQAAQFTEIKLTDSGRGMDEATIARAFEPFFSTKPPGQGTGLGLSQVRSFCELSGGHCSIANAPSGGATVSLFLPRAPGQTVLVQRPVTNSATHARTAEDIRMLLVEDDEMVADAQTAMFSAFGYEVTHAANADEAYRLLQPPHNFQIVISDVQMPGKLTGLDLAERLQSEQPELPLMMLTGFVDQAERLRQLGVTAFLKPVVDVAALDDWIRRRVSTLSAMREQAPES